MKKLMLAIFAASLASCSEEPQPPKRTKAPDAPPVVKVDKKVPPPAPPPPEEKPKPPPPPEEKPKPRPPSGPIPKALLDPGAPEWRVTAPAEFKAKFSTTKGDFTILVVRDWAPQGADRFYGLVKNGFYDGVGFFRVISNFMAQFGINGEPSVSTVWRNAKIPDDPNKQSNSRGTITFATSGKNSRTTQVFISFKDNSFLDNDFSPFGKVVEGMEIVDSLYNGYGEGAPKGQGPNQGKVQSEGNAYLRESFDKLDYVKTARIVE
jgi:peptidyl-prolyl cis-trans isomerase A (cyclophilin A)